MKPRRLSKVVQRAFDEWIKPDTWCKAHPNDEARFYAFVWAVVQHSRHRPSESDVREHIYASQGGGQRSEWLEGEALRYSRLYETLYEFAKARSARRLLPLELTQAANEQPA